MRFQVLAITLSLGAILFCIGTSESAAKGSFTKVVVNGPTLEEPIEIADPVSLEFLDMWGMMLIPDSIPEPAEVADSYSITRFGPGHNGEPQPFDELHYYARPNGGRGFVYYDGLVGGWSEYDGKWFHANVCGERILNKHISSGGLDSAASSSALNPTLQTILIAVASCVLGLVFGIAFARRSPRQDRTLS